jgi:putative tricarboxylic transport membrane protein
MQRRIDHAGLAVAALLVLLAGLVYRDMAALELSPVYGVGPKAMPMVVATGLMLLAAGNALLAWRGGEPEREAADPRAIATILGGFVALIAIIALGGGFVPATAVLFAATASAFGRKAFVTDLAIGFGLGLAAYLMFSKVLTLSLPTGPIERLF